jgi:hypothetical protein
MKLRLLVALATVIACTHMGPAVADETPWIADAKGCKFANPYPQPKETVTWTGPCLDGMGNGDGVLQWFEDGKQTAHYEGRLAKGWANGRGTLTNADGTIYKGDWKDSRENGEGRLDWPDGIWYEGEWRDGKPNGYGQYRSPEGRMLTGKFVDGEFEPDENDQEKLPPGQNKT